MAASPPSTGLAHTGLAHTEPAGELLSYRKARALRVSIGARVLIVIIMLPFAWALGTVLFDKIMTAAL
ncbi:MAG: hypothetical protein GKR94_04530 [Gammaproteobacteria bacterium]|nr:hypothetical protein [Gammaproteobacteria bacterium]